MLRKPSKLLGVGFKGYHGTSIGQAKFHNLTKEVELVRDGKLVEVFVKQPLNDQGPPKYCVVAPERAAAFERASRVGIQENVVLYSALLAQGFRFVDGATAAQQLVEAYDAHGWSAPAREASASPALKTCPPHRMTTFDDFLVATAGIHDSRGKNLEARKREEFVWALTELCVRSFPGAGKAQFEITYRLLALALELNTTVRIGCYEATVKSMEPEDWVRTMSPKLSNRIESSEGFVATLASTVPRRRPRRPVRPSPPLNRAGRPLHALLVLQGGRLVPRRRRVLDDGAAPGAGRVLGPKARLLGPVRESGQGHLLRRELGGVVASDAKLQLPPRARRRRARGAPGDAERLLPEDRRLAVAEWRPAGRAHRGPPPDLRGLRARRGSRARSSRGGVAAGADAPLPLVKSSFV